MAQIPKQNPVMNSIKPSQLIILNSARGIAVNIANTTVAI